MRCVSIWAAGAFDYVLLLGLLLILNAGNSLGGSAIQALFFARFGVQFLPQMFIVLGIITFAFGMGGPIASFAGLLHMTVHSLTKSAIFFAVGHAVQKAGTQTMDEIRAGKGINGP